MNVKMSNNIFAQSLGSFKLISVAFRCLLSHGISIKYIIELY